MPALQVKDCPTFVYEKLRECAFRENRSISQQALTIIESYLGLREEALPANISNPGSSLLTRRKVSERIGALEPIPNTHISPDSAVILEEARRDDAL